MQILAALIIFIFDVALFKRIVSSRDGSGLNVFFSFYYIFQMFIAMLILAIDFDFTIDLVGYSAKLRETFLPYAIGSLYAVFGIFFGIKILNSFYQTRDSFSLIQRGQLLCLSVNINLLSVLLSLFFCFDIITVFFPFYLVNVVFATFSFCPA